MHACLHVCVCMSVYFMCVSLGVLVYFMHVSLCACVCLCLLCVWHSDGIVKGF